MHEQKEKKVVYIVDVGAEDPEKGEFSSEIDTLVG